ncbi:MAG: helix-turn-helix domain containing protein [Terracidiphilus sp.]|nr:helix-turn-helix domain containing protein [Terracidiphilus sp.]
MARPRSGDKHKAILDAALRICAERGIAGAPTSAISKAAGIAEGSLFTYFKTKNDLLNELYEVLRTEFSRHLPDFPHGADARARLRYIWDRILDLGAAHPEQLTVLAQLRASGKMVNDNRAPTFALAEVMRAAIELTAGSELSDLPAEYLVLMVRAQTEITIEYINAHPESAAVCRALGFQILLKGLTGS